MFNIMFSGRGELMSEDFKGDFRKRKKSYGRNDVTVHYFVPELAYLKKILRYSIL